jgi:peptidyl-prolyl cis-trans isomerase SurA
VRSCENLQRDFGSIEGVNILDLGRTTESDLSPAIRDRIQGVANGQAAAVQTAGDQVNTFIVCSRETGGSGVPDRREIESRLREQEMAMLAERYLRNLRREATIITRN